MAEDVSKCDASPQESPSTPRGDRKNSLIQSQWITHREMGRTEEEKQVNSRVRSQG